MPTAGFAAAVAPTHISICAKVGEKPRLQCGQCTLRVPRFTLLLPALLSQMSVVEAAAAAAVVALAPEDPFPT